MFDYAVKKARELSEDYVLHALNGAAKRKCEKQFLWRCQQNLQLNINPIWLPENLPTTAMRGTCVRTSGGYDILLLPKMDPTLTRFVLVKEIFHAIFDIEAVYQMNLLQHLDSTLFGDSKDMPLHAQSEYAAHAAAAEFLFPYSERLAVVKNGRYLDPKALSTEFDMPSSIVEYYLSASAMEFYAFP